METRRGYDRNFTEKCDEYNKFADYSKYFGIGSFFSACVSFGFGTSKKINELVITKPKTGLINFGIGTLLLSGASFMRTYYYMCKEIQIRKKKNDLDRKCEFISEKSDVSKIRSNEKIVTFSMIYDLLKKINRKFPLLVLLAKRFLRKLCVERNKLSCGIKGIKNICILVIYDNDARSRDY